jgi:hypothetical protein
MTPNWSWLHELLFGLAWPTYECQSCVGQEWYHGCYCAYHNAFGPCDPKGAFLQRTARRWYLWARTRRII